MSIKKIVRLSLSYFLNGMHRWCNMSQIVGNLAWVCVLLNLLCILGHKNTFVLAHYRSPKIDLLVLLGDNTCWFELGRRASHDVEGTSFEHKIFVIVLFGEEEIFNCYTPTFLGFSFFFGFSGGPFFNDVFESELLKAQKQVQVKIKVLGWDRLTSSLMIIGG